MFFMARKYGIFLFIILIIAILSSGCSGSSTKENSNSIGSSSTVSPSTVSDSETGLLVESHIETRNNGIKYVVGSVRNNGPQYNYVELYILFYDSSGEEIDRALQRIHNLDNGETNKFEVYMDAHAASYKINDISAHL